MVIFNNMAAMSALNENNRNTGKLGKVIKQASSGMRINSAGDDASGYSISEKMRVKIRALGQCKENSAKGQDLIDTASAAIDEQVNIMKQVKTIALKATDGTYTDSDRRILQKELSQMLDQSEDIANTQFNGISLLNQSMVSRSKKWFDADAPYRVNRNNIPVLAQAASGDYPVRQGVYVEVTSSSTLFDASITTPGGVLTTKPIGGTVVFDAAKNSHTVYQDTVNNKLYLDSATGHELDLDGTGCLVDTTDGSYIYDGKLPRLTVPFAAGMQVSTSYVYPPINNFTIEVDKYKSSPGNDVLTYFDPSVSVPYNSITELDLSSLGTHVANVPQDLDGLGFSFDCGGCDQFVTIMFDASTGDSKLYEGNSGSPPPLCYVIGVENVTTVPSLEESLGQAIFNGVNEATKWTKGTSLPSSSDTSTTITNDHNIQLNYYAASGKISITKSGPRMTMKNGLMGEMKVDVFYKPEQNLYLQTDAKGSFHTKISLPNTTLSMLFADSSAHWDIEPEESDYPDKWPSEYDFPDNWQDQYSSADVTEAQKRERWEDEIWKYPNHKVDLDVDNCVSTIDKANEFLAGVDQAIKYLLNANTTLGAESSRLDYTQDNIVVMQENTTAAESVQRDADMAKTMMEYAKYNLLQQASQSMLAQANQTPNGVLGLLQ
ncbi:MAG: flagellin [Anaerovibrio sp.]